MLVPILKNIRDDKATDPILIHCVTEKGRGYNDVMQSSDKLHAVTKFDPETGVQEKSSSNNPSYSKIFGKRLSELAKKDEKNFSNYCGYAFWNRLRYFRERS